MATTTASPPPSDDRARLRSHFNGPESTHPDRWAQLWEAGDFLPWDRGGPNPALIDLLNEKRAIIGDYFVEDASASKRRKTALVPGCGRGYDVLLLANHGYDAYGLEVSEKAVERCYEEKKVNEHKYMRKGHSNNAGTSTFIKGDFFDTQWVHAVPGGKFDLIYDYTGKNSRTTRLVMSKWEAKVRRNRPAWKGYTTGNRKERMRSAREQIG
ncbi:MAG: hypothetical protein Q9224_001254 [Gallowayella concinna]